jgi:UDP-N-acetylmuramate--alanine ligase
VIVAPVYSAGEQPIDGATHDALALGLKSRGHRNVQKIDDAAELAPLIAQMARPGDIVICLGAGTITQWAYALPMQLAALDRAARQAAGKGAA